MKQFIVSLIIASIIAGYYLYQDDQMVVTDIAHNTTLHANKVSESSPLTSIESSLNVDDPNTSPLELPFNSEALINAPLSQLKASIILFWQQCRRENLCQQWLSALETKLTEQRYRLIAQYPENQQQLALLLQDAPLNESLDNKVTTVKSIYQQVWGEEASILFNEEFSFYDSRVELSKLADQSELYQPSEILELLDATPHNDNKPITSIDVQEKYNQAVELLSAKLSIQEQAQLKIALAERYFPAEQAQNIAIRQHQIIEQQQQVQSYQNQLLALRLELSQQRDTTLSNLSENEWQAYQSQALTQFRRDFFTP